MRYLDDSHIRRMDIKWWELIHTIEKVAYSLENLEYAQPLKPYLRFGDSKNRIIAMPAYVGNDIHAAGIKWISSFPDNINNGIKRAHSITILNDPDTGEPLTVMNTPEVSIIRTAAVTGTMLKHYLLVRKLKNVTVGIIGLGPVGEAHYKLIRDMFGHTVERVLAYDLMEERLNGFIQKYNQHEDLFIRKVEGWNEIICESDIVITCTVAANPYIDLPPKIGSLQLNISLRDYKSTIFPYVRNGIVVDSWQEVCREGTNIQQFSVSNGLKEEHVMTLMDVINKQSLTKLLLTDVVMFNPMGMAVFDIAIGKLLYEKAEHDQIGIQLNS